MIKNAICLVAVMNYVAMIIYSHSSSDDTLSYCDRVVLRYANTVHHLLEPSGAVIYTYEDVELRRIFPSEFPQDTVRKTGNVDAEHLGRYAELQNYFRFPKSKLNSHFEEMSCLDQQGKRLCQVDFSQYSDAENSYYMSKQPENPMDPRRVYCIFLLCFTREELDKVVNMF